MTPCNVMVGYQPFEGPRCPHFQFTLKMEVARSSEAFGALLQHDTASQPRRLPLCHTNLPLVYATPSEIWQQLQCVCVCVCVCVLRH